MCVEKTLMKRKPTTFSMKIIADIGVWDMTEDYFVDQREADTCLAQNQKGKIVMSKHSNGKAPMLPNYNLDFGNCRPEHQLAAKKDLIEMVEAGLTVSSFNRQSNRTDAHVAYDVVGPNNMKDMVMVVES